MARAYHDGLYLARTLAVTILDLEPSQRTEILDYLQRELERLTHVSKQSESDQDQANTQAWNTHNREDDPGDNHLSS